MQSDTTLVLGAFQFGGLEIPEEIRIGGSQRLSVHELVGGVRVIDAMGRSDRALEWSGLLLGSGKDAKGNTVATSAIDRARYLDTVRASGVAQPLIWSAFTYLVVVREFEASYKKAYHIPYRIVCEVISDLTSPITASGQPPVDQAIGDDAKKLTSLIGSIGNLKLSGLMGTLTSAIGAVSSFAHAAQSTINSVLAPLAAVQAQVQTLITSAANTLGNVTTFGGLLPGNPLSSAAAALTNQVVNMTQLNTLYQANSLLGRMAGNLGSINSATNTVATAGGNLFQIAQKQFGDSNAWTGIAKANGLTDPFIQGAKVLTIPSAADLAAGVLGA
jgi:hypothetical protein